MKAAARKGKKAKIRPKPMLPTAQDAENINKLHKQIRATTIQSLQHMRDCGKLLQVVHDGLVHGEWMPWCDANLDFTVQTANAYRRINAGWPQIEAKLKAGFNLETVKEALALLAEPRPPTGKAAKLNPEPEPQVHYITHRTPETPEPYEVNLEVSARTAPDAPGSDPVPELGVFVRDGKKRKRSPRGEAESGGESPHLTKPAGTDGNEQPAKKPESTKPDSSKDTSTQSAEVHTKADAGAGDTERPKRKIGGWSLAVRDLIHILVSPNFGDEQREMAVEQLEKMAEMADAYIESQEAATGGKAVH